MKKIAFVTDSIHIGGIERSLIELLDGFDYQAYDVSLFLLDPSGGLFNFLHQDVHLCKWDQDANALLKDHLKHIDITGLIKDVTTRILVHKNISDHHKTLYYSTKCYPQYSNETFHCAIAYQINSPSVVVSVLEKIRSEKKVAFYHGKSVFPPNDPAFWDSVFARFDRIYCVSESARREFSSEYPVSAHKTEIMHNQLNANKIRIAAEAPVPSPLRNRGHRIVTVGRLSEEKGQDMIPKTARMLLDAGYEIYWYIVGDGYMRQEIQRSISQHRVEDHVIMLGAQKNPYPYIKNCDIYVQTSRSEGWCLTTQEARILCKPIVTTDIPVMHEQFVHKGNGLIANGVSSEALADSIKELLDDHMLCDQLVASLKRACYTTTDERQRLYSFIEQSCPSNSERNRLSGGTH